MALAWASSTAPCWRNVATLRNLRTAWRPPRGGRGGLGGPRKRKASIDELSSGWRPPQSLPFCLSYVPCLGPVVRRRAVDGLSSALAATGGVWLRKSNSPPVRAGGEWPQASWLFDAIDAERPLRTSSATTLASRSGNILASMVWFRSMEPRRDGSDLGWPLGETPAAEKADSSRLPILSTLSNEPTRSATSSKGSRSCVATAAMASEGCWWLRSPVGAPRFTSPRSFAVFEVGEDLPSFVASRVLVTPAFFFAD
mmetsp:Transcript_5370/g.13499  ORF Transcript_5370/g.13499 Transcript_5370/m.13499 type:complete len:255 (+) Transcript_5370:1280-2044(+)